MRKLAPAARRLPTAFTEGSSVVVLSVALLWAPCQHKEKRTADEGVSLCSGYDVTPTFAAARRSSLSGVAEALARQARPFCGRRAAALELLPHVLSRSGCDRVRLVKLPDMCAIAFQIRVTPLAPPVLANAPAMNSARCCTCRALVFSRSGGHSADLFDANSARPAADVLCRKVVVTFAAWSVRRPVGAVVLCAALVVSVGMVADVMEDSC